MTLFLNHTQPHHFACSVWGIWDLEACSRLRNYVHFKVKFVYLVHFESSVLRAPMHAQGENLIKEKSQCKDSTLFLVTVDP